MTSFELLSGRKPHTSLDSLVPLSKGEHQNVEQAGGSDNCGESPELRLLIAEEFKQFAWGPDFSLLTEHSEQASFVSLSDSQSAFFYTSFG